MNGVGAIGNGAKSSHMLKWLSAVIMVFFLGPTRCLAQEPPPSVTAGQEVVVAKPAFREVVLTGYTRARQWFDLISEEAGRCIRVFADVGDVIGEDGRFAVLDSTFVELALKKNGVNQRQMERAIAFEAKEVSRYQKLVKRDSAAESVLDSLENRLDQNRLQLEALKIEEKNLQERLARHIIGIPPGWTVIERKLEPGQWIPAGRYVGKAGNFNLLIVPFSLSSEELTSLKTFPEGLQLFFPDPGKTLTVSLDRISPAFDPDTRKTKLELLVSGGLSPMRGGLRAELTLQIPDPSGAVWLPISAVSERYDEFRLIRENGDQVPVVLLDEGPRGLARVQSNDVRPGDRFRVSPER
jgi:multidrug efflux pump subunit AcrA (membrane-fusion protein)